MITLLTGGTGGPKLLQGLMQVVAPSEITVIVNTGEDKWLPHGYFSPDIDTVVYTLAGIIDDTCWHGIEGDTFHTHDRLLEMGFDEYLKIGDRDRATHIWRGDLMKSGSPLSETTHQLCERLGVTATVLPMSDDLVGTVIHTDQGPMDLHDYLIKNRCRAEVNDISFSGIEVAVPAPGVTEAIEGSDRIIIAPSNPVTSIYPIIGIVEISDALKKKRADCVAVSPIISGRPVSGPADQFMQAWGIEATSGGVAGLYSEVISTIIVDVKEVMEAPLGIDVKKTGILMKTDGDKRKLAGSLLV